MSPESSALSAGKTGNLTTIGATADGEFEFSEQQNGVFRELARAMKFVGTFLLVVGTLVGLFGLVQVIAAAIAETPAQAAGGVMFILQALVYVLIGMWTRNASADVSRVATTSGNDIHHLMAAMGELKRVYVLQKTLLLIALGIVALGAVAFAVFVGVAASR